MKNRFKSFILLNFALLIAMEEELVMLFPFFLRKLARYVVFFFRGSSAIVAGQRRKASHKHHTL